MKKNRVLAIYRRSSSTGRDAHGRPAKAILPVPGAERVRCLIFQDTGGIGPDPIPDTAHGPIPKGRWSLIVPRRGPQPRRGDFLKLEPYGGPERFQVLAYLPIGGRFDNLVTAAETSETFG